MEFKSTEVSAEIKLQLGGDVVDKKDGDSERQLIVIGGKAKTTHAPSLICLRWPTLRREQPRKGKTPAATETKIVDIAR